MVEAIRRLANEGRLDLSVEGIMLENEYSALFTENEREAARWRLERVKKVGC